MIECSNCGKECTAIPADKNQSYDDFVENSLDTDGVSDCCEADVVKSV